MQWKGLLGRLRLYEWTDKLFDMLLLTILWMAGMLPVLTVGASCSAFYDTFQKSVVKGEGYILKTFADSYRDNLKYGAAGTVMLALAIFILGTNIGIIMEFQRGDVRILGIGFYGILLALCFGFFAYFFTLISRFRMKLGWIVKAAFYLEFRKPLHTAVLVAVIAADLFLFRISPVFLVVMPCISVYVIFRIMDPLMKTLYEPIQRIKH